MGFLNHPILLLVIFTFIGIEFFLSKKKKLDNFTGYEALTSLLLMAFDLVFEFFSNSNGSGVMTWIWNHRFFTFDFGNIGNFIVTFLAVEFMYYISHWYNHQVNLGWASHIIHHSPTKMNFTVAYRSGITRLFSLVWIVFPLLILFGFQPVYVIFCMTIILFYQFLLHTELFPKVKYLDYFLNTPSAHRVHHSSNPTHYNKNLGGTILLFDHLFGTYYAEDDDRVGMKYGITSIMEKKSLWYEVTSHWQKMYREFFFVKGFRKKAYVLFGSAGQKYTN